MGQSSSRIQEQPPQSALTADANQPSVAGVTPDLQPDSALDHEGAASNRPQSRRSSLRKSILKLVKPTNTRNRIHNDAQNPGDVRRSWRNSRRWSRAPHSTGLQEEGITLQGSPSESSAAGPSNSSPSSLAKGKQREIIEELDDPATPATLDETLQLSYPTSVLDSELPSTSTQSSSVIEDASVAVPQNIDDSNPEDFHTESGCDMSSPHPAPVEDINGPLPSASELPQTALHQSQQQANPLQRQFPPPGTLVVVQGIVHTTDVSRPDNNTSQATANLDNISSAAPIDIPSDQTPPRRNRLSALLRPRSSSRPVSAIINEPLSTAAASSQTEPVLNPGSDSQTSLEESTLAATVTPSAAEPTNPTLHDILSQPSHQSQLVTENRTPTISSSSIDVLGTLLSVAAAATAASLLTGSSEPILSSGLAPPLPNTHSSRIPHSHSPSQNASMPDLPPYDLPHPNAGFPDASAGRTERMRQAWSTIRERLGLRPSTSPSDGDIGNSSPNTNNIDNPSASSSSDPVGLPSPTDTRELMLAEMARAFNIGLGLNGLGGLAPAANPTDVNTDGGIHNDAADSGEPNPAVSQESTPESQPMSQSSHVTLPPEGSFERFLVDLQVDLRIALTRPEEEAEPESTHQSPLQHISQTNSQQSHSFNTGDALPSHQPTSLVPPSSTAEQPLQSSNALDSPTPVSSNPPSEEDVDYTEMPALQDHSDSETEFEDEDREDEDYEDDFQSTEQRSVGNEGHQTFGNSQSLPTSSGTGRIDSAGRINWWRLYRFPPIVSPHLEATRDPMASSTPSPTSNPPTSATTLDDIAAGLANSNIASNLPHSASNTSLMQSPSVNTSAEPSTHSVVPVIVVGLQSVNSEWRPDLRDEGLDFFGQPTSGEGMDDENGGNDDLEGWATQQHVGTGAGDIPLDGARGRGRTRGWQSRAADAIRNLRPGRRNAEANLSAQLPAVTPGSRTFLIYVIGGYYPPDHNIVTGGPNILDSFEALLELADLLGQVKPPTASKDDIEKSGLEIIKASDLPQHEKDGKVSSNCTDRCLICLDDYEPEDPIRVMSCRHAFHKTCVDEWLLRGRNNCPACRSTGVSTDSHSTAPLPPTMVS